MKKVITVKVNLCYEERIYSQFRQDAVISRSYDDVVISHTATLYDCSESNTGHDFEDFVSDLVRKIVEDDSCRITSFLIMTEQKYKSVKLMCATKFLTFLANSVTCIINKIFEGDLLSYETKLFSERSYYDKYYVDISTPVSITIK